jgi:aldehyde dehydrogenase (NAD+)
MSAQGSDIVKYDMFIDGKWRKATSGRVLKTTNPFTGKFYAEIEDADADDVAVAVSAARAAFDHGPWGKSTARERAILMERLAGLMRRDAEKLAAIECRENGKVLSQMIPQWQYMPEWMTYYAGLADKIEGSTIPSDRPNFMIYTRKEPAGVVGSITPWNSPGFLLIYKLAPAFAAGCTFVLKPSEYAPSTALEIAKLIEEAGFPAGVFNVVTGGPESGKALVASPDVDRIAFTGSVNVGKAVAVAAADNLTNVLLELGGKSPNIIFDDCDLDVAVDGIIGGIYAANGQSCMVGSRLLVQRTIVDRLLEKVVARMKAAKLGDPFDPKTDIGPLANTNQFNKVKGMIERAVSDGAKLACGGPAPEVGPLFYRPSILVDAKLDMEVIKEEIFGPVTAIIPFDTEEEAIAIANDSRFGLAAAVFSLNVHRCHRVAHAIRAGTVWINSYRIVSYLAPFGGWKISGIGRENGLAAVDEYLEQKTVWVEMSGKS